MAYWGPIAAVILFWCFFSGVLADIARQLTRIADALENKKR